MRPLFFLALPVSLALSTAVARAEVQVIVGGPEPARPSLVAPKTKSVAKPSAHVHSEMKHDVQPLMITPYDRPAAQTSFATAPVNAPLSMPSYANSIRSRLIAVAMQFVGTPYVWGGASPSGFDCSGFVQYSLASVGIRIPRTADDQFYALPAVADPQPGDLVFFQTYEPGPSHVGIYLGNGTFINSIGNDVHISSFASSYFTSRYLGARRAVF